MRISGSNIVKASCAILLLGILAVSCGKDPIFYLISTETAPVPPRIPGAPTNMVVFEREIASGDKIKFLFVASGRLHWYGSPDPVTESPGWDRDYGIPQPGGKIIALAVTKDHLYALCLSGNSLRATLRRIGKGHNDSWQEMTNSSSTYTLIQSIYSTYSDDPADDGQLFVGARKNDKENEDYGILYLSGTTLKTLRDNTTLLSGAAYRNSSYYVCTRSDDEKRGGRILKVSTAFNSVTQLNNIGSEKIKVPKDPQVEPPEFDDKWRITYNYKDISFMGMIKLKNTEGSIIAIERDRGYLYEILTDTDVNNMFPSPQDTTAVDALKDSAFSQIYYKNGDKAETGGYAMGGLALWEGDSTKLLVASRQGTLLSTSYNNGYREFLLKSDGSFDKTRILYPSFMYTCDESRYTTSLGKHPINHLFQAPDTVDKDKTFFTSTQTGGLWSYRNRIGSGGWQWNAED